MQKDVLFRSLKNVFKNKKLDPFFNFKVNKMKIVLNLVRNVSLRKQERNISTKNDVNCF